VGVLFPAFIVAVVVLAIVYWSSLIGFFTSREDVQAWIASFGATAPLVFIAVQVFQVVVFVVPGEIIQITGGYLFGVGLGTLYSIVGIAVGSTVGFWVARFFGRVFVEGVFGVAQVEKFDSFTSSRGPQVGFFLLFVIPGIPKDVLIYLGGLSTLKFLTFLGISMAGRLPGILGSAVIGDSVADSRWVLGIVIFAVSVVLFAIGLIFRTRIMNWVTRAGKPGDAEDN